MTQNSLFLPVETSRNSKIHDISIRFALLMILAAMAACGGGTSTPANVDGTCHQPDATSAAVPECARTSVCLASSQAVVVDSAHCTAATCRWTYQVDLGDTLTYEDGDNWVFIRFDRPIAGATATDQLSAAGPSVNFYRTFPVSGGTSDLVATYFEQRTGVASFDQFDLAGGKLHAKLSFTVQDPYALISSQDTGCAMGDVSGRCNCVYSGVDIPASSDVDLPADIPAS
jgi:hypothetical protein